MVEELYFGKIDGWELHIGGFVINSIESGGGPIYGGRLLEWVQLEMFRILR